MKKQFSPHPDSDVLQAFAEGDLTGETAQAARTHLSGCARCRAEVEGWELLFAELGELPDLDPSPEFAARVMAGIDAPAATPAQAGWLERLRGWIRIPQHTPASEHLSGAGIQSYLEGLLDRGTRARVEAHLGACTSCRTEHSAWTALFDNLDQIPRLSPSAHFADDVMAGVHVSAIGRVAAAAEPGWGKRLADTTRRLLPSSTRGWAVAGGLFAAPSVGLIAAVTAVIVHPLLSIRDLALFVSWRANELGAIAWSRTIEALTNAPGAYWLIDALRDLSQTPGLAAVGLLALWATSMAAAWVLYRYIIAPTLSMGHHAKRF